MDEQERAAKLQEIARKRVLYQLPGMESCPVRRDIPFRQAGDQTPPLMDIYYPPAIEAGTAVPVVVIAFGFQDPHSQIRAYGPMTSWARLIAASGMAAALYGTTKPADDIHTVLDYLRRNAASLDLDERRIALFSVSGSVPVALAALMRDGDLRCAALLCGYTFDVEGSTAFAEASREYGYVYATEGRSINELPANVPLIVVRAGLEQFPGVNAGLDQFAANALALNLPLIFVNHAVGRHGFEYDEDSVASRGVIQQVLAFLRLHTFAS